MHEICPQPLPLILPIVGGSALKTTATKLVYAPLGKRHHQVSCRVDRQPRSTTLTQFGFPQILPQLGFETFIELRDAMMKLPRFPRQRATRQEPTDAVVFLAKL